MKIEAVTIHDDNTRQKSANLRDTLKNAGIELNEIILPFTFGQQYDQLYNYCVNYHGDASHLLYNDAFDVVCFGSIDEVMDKFQTLDCKMLISTEKACFPYAHKAGLYPASATEWKYINGGGSLFEIEYFINAVKQMPFDINYIDPDYLLKLYLNDLKSVKLDCQCSIFQTIAHSSPAEWTYKNNRFENNITKTKPNLFHGNGRTDMSWILDKLL